MNVSILQDGGISQVSGLGCGGRRPRDERAMWRSPIDIECGSEKAYLPTLSLLANL
jgi:hypothetical protein